MKKLQSNYPIGQFFIEVFKSSGLELPDFLQAIGYANPTRGMRHLKEFLREGIGPGIFIHLIMKSCYAPCRNAFAFVFIQTTDQIDYESWVKYGVPLSCNKSDFKPFLHAVPNVPEVTAVSIVSSHETNGFFYPYSIFIASSITSLPEKEQNKKISRIIRKNYKHNNGEIDCMGAIGYYLLFRSWGEPPVAFSIKGEFMGVADTAFLPKTDPPEGRCELHQELIKRLVNARGYGRIQ
jgi:hypothetical protein